MFKNRPEKQLKIRPGSKITVEKQLVQVGSETSFN